MCWNGHADGHKDRWPDKPVLMSHHFWETGGSYMTYDFSDWLLSYNRDVINETFMYCKGDNSRGHANYLSFIHA